jgi:PAS domain S-box-containing protein
MCDSLEKLQHDLEDARRALAEAKARCALQDAEHQAAIKELQDSHKKVERAHQQWESALDVMEEPMFMHGKDFHILRCNKAYQRCAGIPFEHIIGQPYYEVFPITHAPLPNCLRALERLIADKEDVLVGDTAYRSCAYPVTDEQGSYLYSVHTFEDITESLRSKESLVASRDLLQNVVENTPIRVFWKDAELRYLGCNSAFAHDAGMSRPEDLIGKDDFQMAWREQAELYRADDKRVMDSDTPKLGYEEPQTTPDGRTIWLRTSKVPLHGGAGKIIGILGIYEDITERKRTSEKLQESERKYRELVQDANSIILRWARDGHIIFINEFGQQFFNYSEEELLGRHVIGTIVPEIESSGRDLKLLMDKICANPKQFEHNTNENMRRSGERVWISWTNRIIFDEHGEVKEILSVGSDITELKLAQRTLQDEKAFADTLVGSLPDIFFLLDLQGGLLKWNKQFTVLFGLSPEELLGANALSFIHEEDRPLIAQKLQQVIETGSASAEARVVMKTGIRNYVLTSTRIETSLGVNVIGIGQDITERKRVDNILHERERQLSIIYDTVGDAIFNLKVQRDGSYYFASVNQCFLSITGLQASQIIGKPIQEVIPNSALPMVLEKYAEAIREKKVVQWEETSDYPTGRLTGEVSIAPVFDDSMNCVGLTGSVHDITERKRNEYALRRANRALKTLSASNLALVRATSEDELLRWVTSVIVETGGYLMAWVGYAEDDAAKTVRPVAQSGYEEGYLGKLNLTWADMELGQGPTGTAIREGATVINQNFLTNPKMAPWREDAIKRGYQSCVAIPLIRTKHVFGALTVYSADSLAFSEEEVKLLEELASDLAFGIETMRARLAYEQHAMILRHSLEDSIRAIADTVEARDPYTAGHQSRVSMLAVAMASEMGLHEETIIGIGLAASIHDLGKISVPAEILAKPTRLTEIEFMLVKNHAQSGYNILKDIKFPWPIANMVLQHHERLDGSGYPQGLKSDQILLESRILAVADVVEAMASHRPYRPALGIEAALEEIERGRGSAYDAAVVDTCLKLFREGRFAFQE